MNSSCELLACILALPAGTLTARGFALGVLYYVAAQFLESKSSRDGETRAMIPEVPHKRASACRRRFPVRALSRAA